MSGEAYRGGLKQVLSNKSQSCSDFRIEGTNLARMLQHILEQKRSQGSWTMVIKRSIMVRKEVGRAKTMRRPEDFGKKLQFYTKCDINCWMA